MFPALSGQSVALLLLAACGFSLAARGVQCQDDQWHYYGNARLVTVTYDELSELADSNTTVVDASYPGFLGVQGRKLLQTGCGTVYADTISLGAGTITTLTFTDMNEIGFDISQTDGSQFSARVVNSDVTQQIYFSTDYWGHTYYCIGQPVSKIADCPGTWSLQIACDNTVNECNLNYAITVYYDTSACGSPPPPPVTVVTQHSPPPPPPVQSCECICCEGSYCTATVVGSFNAASASQCTTSTCIQAYPDECPSATVSGSSGALYQPTTTTSSSTAYTTASGTIALDVTSVTPACQAVSFFQCVKSYSVALSGSGFTLVSTSGTADACGTGIATLQDNGAGATGYFTDGTLFTAANKGSYILVNVDNGTCIGAYSVTSGGPVLGVSGTTSSGSPSFAAVPFAAVLGVVVTALCMLV